MSQEGGQKSHCYENVNSTSRGLYSSLMSDSNVNSESRWFKYVSQVRIGKLVDDDQAISDMKKAAIRAIQDGVKFLEVV